jgi:hypothetical protein
VFENVQNMSHVPNFDASPSPSSELLAYGLLTGGSLVEWMYEYDVVLHGVTVHFDIWPALFITDIFT